MKKRVKFYWYVWLYPILFFLIVLLGFKESGGTDFPAQIYSLQIYEKESLLYMVVNLLWENDEKVFYHIIYNVLHKFFYIGPRLYIALITFAYFGLLTFILLRVIRNDNLNNLTNKSLSVLCVFTFLCFCPVLFAVTRNLCAILFLYAGLLFIFKKDYFIALFPLIVAFFVHEGIIIMYSILIIGWALYYFWIRKSKNNIFRNLIVIAISVFLLVTGSSYFSPITSFFFNQGMLSEHYMDTYGTQKSGDGIYKTVIMLTMLGPLLCLFVNCLIDKRNNLIYGITVAGLFVICLLYGQKVFMVQRIMIFMPVFIGLTSYQICSDYKRKEGRINQLYMIIMWLVPLNVLFQFVIQFKLYFGNFFLI